MRRGAPVLIVGLVAALSCHASEPTSDGPPSSGPIANGVCTAFYDAYVAYLESCGLTDMLRIPDADVRDVFAVRSELVEHYCNDLPKLPGTTKLESALGACTATLAKATAACGGSPFALASACNLAGTLPAGASCSFSAQCASARCSFGPGTGARCGTCEAVAKLGEPCAVAGAVADVDAYCSRDHVWTRFGQDGESCSGSTAPCEPGVSICDDFKTSTCSRLPRAGEACLVLCSNCAPECARGAKCEGGACVAAPSPVKPLPLCASTCSGGDLAGDASAFAPCACGDGAFCFQRTAQPFYAPCVPFRKVGDPCLADSDGPCGATVLGPNPWLVCVDGTCQKPSVCR